MNYYLENTEQVLRELNTSEQGLNSQEAAQRLQKIIVVFSCISLFRVKHLKQYRYETLSRHVDGGRSILYHDLLCLGVLLGIGYVYNGVVGFDG